MDYSKFRQVTEELAEFFQVCHTKTYAAKSTLIRPGDSADTLYYLCEGSAVIVMKNEEGEELIVGHLNQGDFIGEVGMFSKTTELNVTVRAKTDCRTQEITYQHLKSLSQTRLKECYPKLLTLLAENLAKRLLSTTRKATDLAFLDVTGRVKAALKELAAQPDAMVHAEGVQIKATRQEISRMVGCSREMAGRVLRNLQDQGLVWARGKTMIIYAQEHRKKSAVTA